MRAPSRTPPEEPFPDDRAQATSTRGRAPGRDAGCRLAIASSLSRGSRRRTNVITIQLTKRGNRRDNWYKNMIRNTFFQRVMNVPTRNSRGLRHMFQMHGKVEVSPPCLPNTINRFELWPVCRRS